MKKSKYEMADGPVSRQIIGSAIEVHRELGPGLLESSYEACLAYELTARGLRVIRQFPIPVVYKEVRLDCGYRADLLIENSIIVELKTVDHFTPVHKAQLITYLKLSKKSVGLLLNFNAYSITQGLQRVVL